MAGLDREQAQKRAGAALDVGTPLVYGMVLARGLAADLFAYEAELVRVERERDELRRLIDEADFYSNAADAELRVARLEAQLAEARWALELISGGADDDLRLERAEMAGIAYAALAASAEMPEEPDA